MPPAPIVLPTVPLAEVDRFFRKKCSCGLRFWRNHRYRTHYIVQHVCFPQWLHR